MRFPKFTFLGPKLNRLGLVWYLLNSLKALALHGQPASLKNGIFQCMSGAFLSRQFGGEMVCMCPC